VTILARFFDILQAKGTIFCGIPVFAPLGVLHPTDRAGASIYRRYFRTRQCQRTGSHGGHRDSFGAPFRAERAT